MQVIYHPDALAELTEAAEFYESKLPSLGFEFLDEIDRAVATIREKPDRYVPIRGDIRRFSVRRFPYGIYYRLLSDSIRILVVRHHSRHPDLGMDRT